MRGELAQFHGIGAAALHCRSRIPKHVYHGEVRPRCGIEFDRLADSPTPLNVLIDRC